MESDTVTIVCKDGVEFQVNKQISKMCEFFSQILEGEQSDRIELAMVDSAPMNEVIQYC